MTSRVGEERERILDPVDRISEVLFGLIMAMTIVGSLSIATAGEEDLHAVTLAALGCNVAWGLVDAIMYVVRTAVVRARRHALGLRIQEADPETGRRLLAKAMPDPAAGLLGPAEVEAVRLRLRELRLEDFPILRPRDFLEAFAVFVVVVVATLPVVAPFVLTDDPAVAIAWSRAVTLSMLFVGGVALARYAGYERSFRVGVAMAVFGMVLIVVVKALGG